MSGQPRDREGCFDRTKFERGTGLQPTGELSHIYDSADADGPVSGPWSALPESRRRRDLQWAHDVVEHLEVIESYVHHGRAAFDDHDQPWSDGIQMRIVKLGHAVMSMSPEFRSETHSKELKGLLGMRNRVAHDDVAVSDDIVWTTASEHLPRLLVLMRRVIENGGPRP